MFGVFCDQWSVAWTLSVARCWKNAARFRPRIEFLSRMSHRRPRATTMFALVVSLVFYSLITNGFAAPAETSPPPVTPTPEARPSPGNALSHRGHSVEGGRKLGRKNLRHPPSARSHQTVDKKRAERYHRQWGRNQRQTHSDKCACGAICQ